MNMNYEELVAKRNNIIGFDPDNINEFIKKHTEKTNAAFEFNILTLTKEQTRILHSLEYHKIIYDINII